MRLPRLILFFLGFCAAPSLGAVAPSKAPPKTATPSKDSLWKHCFAKIRLASSIQPEIRQQMDRLASIAALDQIALYLQAKTIEMCTPKERDAVETFLDSHSEAIKIADSVAFNMTNGEKDLLNVWNNLNDTESERRFYLSKFHRLPEAQQNVLRDSFAQIFHAYTVSSPPPHFIKFFASLAPKELVRLKYLEEEDNEEEMHRVISSSLQRLKLTADESSDVRRFMNGVFHLL